MSKTVIPAPLLGVSSSVGSVNTQNASGVPSATVKNDLVNSSAGNVTQADAIPAAAQNHSEIKKDVSLSNQSAPAKNQDMGLGIVAAENLSGNVLSPADAANAPSTSTVDVVSNASGVLQLGDIEAAGASFLRPSQEVTLVNGNIARDDAKLLHEASLLDINGVAEKLNHIHELEEQNNVYIEKIESEQARNLVLQKSLKQAQQLQYIGFALAGLLFLGYLYAWWRKRQRKAIAEAAPTSILFGETGDHRFDASRRSEIQDSSYTTFEQSPVTVEESSSIGLQHLHNQASTPGFKESMERTEPARIDGLQVSNTDSANLDNAIDVSAASAHSAQSKPDAVAQTIATSDALNHDTPSSSSVDIELLHESIQQNESLNSHTEAAHSQSISQFHEGQHRDANLEVSSETQESSWGDSDADSRNNRNTDAPTELPGYAPAAASKQSEEPVFTKPAPWYKRMFKSSQSASLSLAPDEQASTEDLHDNREERISSIWENSKDWLGDKKVLGESESHLSEASLASDNDIAALPKEALTNSFTRSEEAVGLELDAKPQPNQPLIDYIRSLQRIVQRLLDAGENEQVRNLLLEHVRTVPNTSPWAYLEYLQLVDEPDAQYREVRSLFNQRFGREAPYIGEESSNPTMSRGIADYQYSMAQLAQSWPGERAVLLLEEWLSGSNKRTFTLNAYNELFMLYDVLEQLHGVGALSSFQALEPAFNLRNKG